MKRQKLSFAMRPFFWILLVGAGLLTACVAPPMQTGSRNVVTLEMDYSDFDQVEISDAFTVQIRQGDTYRVTLEVDEATREYLDVEQRGDALMIRTRPRRLFFTFWIFDATQRAEITMPNLVGVTARDATHITVSGFATDAAAYFAAADASSLRGEIATGDTKITARDASHVELEGDRGDVEIEVGDASTVALTGRGRNVTIYASDASHADLDDFHVQDADIEARDASDVTVYVTGRLDAEAADASHVTYYGAPTVGDTRTSDASSIEGRGGR